MVVSHRFLFSPVFRGEMIQFDKYLFGLKPPNRKNLQELVDGNNSY